MDTCPVYKLFMTEAGLTKCTCNILATSTVCHLHCREKENNHLNKKKSLEPTTAHLCKFQAPFLHYPTTNSLCKKEGWKPTCHLKWLIWGQYKVSIFFSEVLRKLSRFLPCLQKPTAYVWLQHNYIQFFSLSNALTNPKIPDPNISIMACCKDMPVYSVPFHLWGTNCNDQSQSKRRCSLKESALKNSVDYYYNHKTCKTYSKKQNKKGSIFEITEACNIPIACNELAGFLPSLLRKHNVMIIKTSGRYNWITFKSIIILFYIILFKNKT